MGGAPARGRQTRGVSRRANQVHVQCFLPNSKLVSSRFLLNVDLSALVEKEYIVRNLKQPHSTKCPSMTHWVGRPQRLSALLCSSGLACADDYNNFDNQTDNESDDGNITWIKISATAGISTKVRHCVQLVFFSSQTSECTCMHLKMAGLCLQVVLRTFPEVLVQRPA